MKRLQAILLGTWCLTALAAEVMPPPPTAYFNDYAHAVSPATATQLNKTLENFERESSSQVLVAVFPKMQSDSSIEDYTVRVAQSWRAGQKGKDNGAVLFVFIQDRKLFVQVGYGLEGALPDVICKRIIAERITPRFKAGDFDGGLTAGVQSILATIKGEYKGTGQTVAEGRMTHVISDGIGGLIDNFFPWIFVLLIPFVLFRQLKRGAVYSGRGWSGGFYSGGWSGGSGGGGFSSGGGGGGGGGGFSGGGGSFGGGGAGGSW